VYGLYICGTTVLFINYASSEVQWYSEHRW